MNPDLNSLHSYPFEKLGQLKQSINPPQDKSAIALSIGEPQHPTPQFMQETLHEHKTGIAKYPTTKGGIEFRTAISKWLCQRFQLADSLVDPETQILPLSGTREGLFSIAQAVLDRQKSPVVIMPNPFYQIYEGAALLAGAEIFYVNTLDEQDKQPDFDGVPPHVWARCQLLYICSPGNPTGTVIDQETHSKLIHLADKYDFIIASDECYSEIYLDEDNPPQGLLQSAAAMGNVSFKHCLVFHSLSKRSNAPGLRSGFVAGDADLIAPFLKYRTYHGCSLSLPIQKASIAAWQDEQHVIDNRSLYRQKFGAVIEILSQHLDLYQPPASFYLWPKTPIADTAFSQQLFQQQNVTVLPGSFLSRDFNGVNPGENHVRMALVASLEECIDAAERIKQFIITL